MTTTSTPARPAYDDLSSLLEMVADCHAAGDRLSPEPTPQERCEVVPIVARPGLRISAGTRRLADSLHLHLD